MLGDSLEIQTKTQNTIMQKQYKTADGFTFTLQSDGTLTDGDMVFDSLDELKKHAAVQEIETPLMETRAMLGEAVNILRELKAARK